MIVLPEKPGIQKKAGFLFSFGILAAVTACLVSWFLTGRFLLTAFLGAGFTALLLSIEFLWPDTLSPVYRGWNRMAKIYAGFMHRWVAFLSFYLVLSVVGRFGKKEPFVRQEESKTSNWYPKTTLGKDTYASQSTGRATRRNRKSSWMGSFIRSDMLAENKWLIFLLPHLFLLRVSKVKSEQKSQEDIYTLY